MCQLLRDLAQAQLSHFFKAESRAGVKFVSESWRSRLAGAAGDLPCGRTRNRSRVPALAATLIEENPEASGRAPLRDLQRGRRDRIPTARRGVQRSASRTLTKGRSPRGRTWSLADRAEEVGAAAGILGARRHADGVLGRHEQSDGATAMSASSWRGGGAVIRCPTCWSSAGRSATGPRPTATTAPLCASGAGDRRMPDMDEAALRRGPELGVGGQAWVYRVHGQLEPRAYKKYKDPAKGRPRRA